MRIAKGTLLALGACALFISAGCGEDKSVVEETVPAEGTESGGDLQDALDGALDDVKAQGEKALDDAKDSVEKLKAERKAEVQRLKAEMASRIEALEERIKSDPMKAADIGTMIEELTTEYEEKIAAVKADYKKRVEAAE